jgi:hypothetical protein
MNYAPRPYYRVSMNRKRQIIDQQLDELHTIQLDMIDQAVALSDLRDARELIEYIKNL